jgi:hypothetical protein
VVRSITAAINPRAMLLAFAAGSALLLGRQMPTNAQTTALSPEEASARWVCRQSGDTLTHNAAMNDAQHTLLTCMPLHIEARMSDNTIVRIGNARSDPATGPDLSHALSADQINDAWLRFVMTQLHYTPLTGGG